MGDVWTYFITWNTYGTWLPSVSRGWLKRRGGFQLPRPFLEQWCREQMTSSSVLLSPEDRQTVESACSEHCMIHAWSLLAVNARTNHVHLVVTANTGPKVTRDQLKANCTSRLRRQPVPLNVERTWAKGGDTEILDTEDEIQACILYTLEAQDIP